MNRFFEDSSDFLGEGSMFGGGSAAEGFFQVVGDIGSDEDAFPISHRLLRTPY